MSPPPSHFASQRYCVRHSTERRTFTRFTDYRMDTLRHRFRLSQKELAYLAGKNSRSAISRYENDHTPPPLDVLISFEIIFGVCLSDLFPERFSALEDLILARANAFWNKLEGKTDHASNRKRALLLEIIERAKAPAPNV